jgi:hypothetical protein
VNAHTDSHVSSIVMIYPLDIASVLPEAVEYADHLFSSMFVGAKVLHSLGLNARVEVDHCCRQTRRVRRLAWEAADEALGLVVRAARDYAWLVASNEGGEEAPAEAGCILSMSQDSGKWAKGRSSAATGIAALAENGQVGCPQARHHGAAGDPPPLQVLA